MMAGHGLILREIFSAAVEMSDCEILLVFLEVQKNFCDWKLLL